MDRTESIQHKDCAEWGIAGVFSLREIPAMCEPKNLGVDVYLQMIGLRPNDVAPERMMMLGVAWRRATRRVAIIR